MAEHWRLKPEVSWVRLLATAGFFTCLYFCLITSKFNTIIVLCLRLCVMFSPYTLHADVTVENVTTNLPPVVNRTDSGCFYSCPFNNRSSSQRLGVATGQPCVYTLKVTRVFKGNYTVSCMYACLHSHIRYLHLSILMHNWKAQNQSILTLLIHWIRKMFEVR